MREAPAIGPRGGQSSGYRKTDVRREGCMVDNTGGGSICLLSGSSTTDGNLYNWLRLECGLNIQVGLQGLRWGGGRGGCFERREL